MKRLKVEKSVNFLILIAAKKSRSDFGLSAGIRGLISVQGVRRASKAVDGGRV